MALQLQTPTFPWEASLKIGWPFHSHFGVSTWCSRIAGPNGWHSFQGEWSKIKALHLEPPTRYRHGIYQFDGSRLFVLKFITNTLGSSAATVRSSTLPLYALACTSAPPHFAHHNANTINRTFTCDQEHSFRGIM
jgi:hypothetical protein